MWSTSSSEWQKKHLFAKEYPLLWTWSKIKAFPQVTSHAKKVTLGGAQDLQMMFLWNNRVTWLQNRIERFNRKVPTQGCPYHPIFHILMHPFCLELHQKALHTFHFPIIKGPRELRSPTTPFTFGVPNIRHLSFLK